MRREVAKWVAKAEQDLDDAKFNLDGNRFETSVFLSHQAAEKALKALYILKFERLWKIHDLRELSVAIDADADIVEACKVLNPHYIATRYPLEVEYGDVVARRAYRESRKVIEWVKKTLAF